MANSKFTDSNGANPYVLIELPVLPSDRPDLTIFANTDRTIMEYTSVGMIVALKYLTTRGRATFRFERISQQMVERIKYFAVLAYFRFYPDAGSATYFEMYVSNEFAPRWQPGGIYNLTLELRQYSPS